jgi:flagellar FliL protein
VAEETKPVEEKPAPKKSINVGQLILILVVTVVSNVAGAGMTWYLLGRPVAHAEASVAEGAAAPEEEDDIAAMLQRGAVVPLEPFVVNLADPDAARYLRIKISLMVDDKEKVAEVIENQALQLKVRDTILQTLTRKTSQDLINDEGKNKLRQEIRDQVEPFFRDPNLMDVMFTGFVIQL